MKELEKLQTLNIEDALIASLGGFLIIILIISIAIIVLEIIGKCKLFKKAGKQGWEAIIPFYSTWVLVEIAGLAWWWMLIIIAPTIINILKIKDLTTISYLATIFGSFCCNYNISKKLHQDTSFAVLITLFPFILIPIIGFSEKYKFDNNVQVSELGPFEKKEENIKKTYCPNCGFPTEKENQYCKNCGTKLK